MDAVGALRCQGEGERIVCGAGTEAAAPGREGPSLNGAALRLSLAALAVEEWGCREAQKA